MRTIPFKLAVLLASLFIAPQYAQAVTYADTDAVEERAVVSVTTSPAERAESDLQVRRIRSLLVDEEISSDSFLAQVEKLRRKLGH